jgi:hypothetical protein
MAAIVRNPANGDGTRCRRILHTSFALAVPFESAGGIATNDRPVRNLLGGVEFCRLNIGYGFS